MTRNGPLAATEKDKSCYGKKRRGFSVMRLDDCREKLRLVLAPLWLRAIFLGSFLDVPSQSEVFTVYHLDRLLGR